MSFNSAEVFDVAATVGETELFTKPSEVRPDRPRKHSRYPIDLGLQYKLIAKGRVQHRGQGRTLNISSGGVLFAPDDIQKLVETLEPRDVVELVLDWPLLLQKVCLLKLVVFGEIVRRDGEKLAIKMNRYEFRTAGAAAPRAS